MSHHVDELFHAKCTSKAPIASIDTGDLQVNLDCATVNNEWVWVGLDLNGEPLRSLRVGWSNDSNPDFFTIVKLTAVVGETSEHIHVISAVIDEVVVVDPNGVEKRVYAHNLTISGLLNAITKEFDRLNIAIMQNKLTPSKKIHSISRNTTLVA